MAGIAEIEYSGKCVRRLSYAAQHINNANCRVRELSETRSAAPLCKPAYPGGPGSVQTTPKSLRSEKYHKFLWQGLYLEAAHRTGWLGWLGWAYKKPQAACRKIPCPSAAARRAVGPQPITVPSPWDGRRGHNPGKQVAGSPRRAPGRLPAGCRQAAGICRQPAFGIGPFRIPNLPALPQGEGV